MTSASSLTPRKLGLDGPPQLQLPEGDLVGIPTQADAQRIAGMRPNRRADGVGPRGCGR